MIDSPNGQTVKVLIIPFFWRSRSICCVSLCREKDFVSTHRLVEELGNCGGSARGMSVRKDQYHAIWETYCVTINPNIDDTPPCNGKSSFCVVKYSLEPVRNPSVRNRIAE
jgi:hypothetical protein